MYIGGKWRINVYKENVNTFCIAVCNGSKKKYSIETTGKDQRAHRPGTHG